MSSFTLFDPPGLQTNPVYVNAISTPIKATTKLITIAGQTARKADGSVDDTLKEQMQVSLNRLEACLKAAGATKKDMTKLTCGWRSCKTDLLRRYYFADAAWEGDKSLKEIYEVVTPWLEGNRPTSCCLIVARLSQPRFMCEFSAEAIID